ncbi:MAG: tryptophan-rich sensory protein [Anaerolineae bacterium]
MRRDVVRQVVNVIAYVVTIAVNILANALPLNNQTTGEISDRYPVLFTPAAYVFGIWLVIYTFLGAFTIYQALPQQRANPHLRRIGYLFALSGLANSIWIVFWHYDLLLLSLLAMLVLLGALIAIYLRLEIGRRTVSRVDRWLIHVPFSIYLGWITVATIANVSVLLFAAGWDGFGIDADTWTILVLIVGVAITLAVLATRLDVAYGLVIVWAYAGIVVRQQANPAIALTAAGAALIVLLAVAVVGLKRLRTR